MDDFVEGMCCDCIHGMDAERPPFGDYSENPDCPHQKEDGSCWMAAFDCDKCKRGATCDRDQDYTDGGCFER